MGSQKLLDHGYIEVVESWGSDERIIEAARMSVNKGFKGWGALLCDVCNTERERKWLKPGDECPTIDCHGRLQVTVGDEKLLAYLWNNKHATPFEMAGLVIDVQAPIFVFREWHRHRTQSYNEMSARYTPLPDLNYIPSVERLMLKGGANKQASAIGDELTEAFCDAYRAMLTVMYAEQEELYQIALKRGVPKELARLHLPVGRYSRMRASANLRNWLGFLTLRQAPNAQWEIRQYADALNRLLIDIFPRTMELFNAPSNI